MKFTVWMNQEKQKAAQIAQSLAIPLARVLRILNGASPRLDEALIIQDYTGGKVTLDDFLQQQQQR